MNHSVAIRTHGPQMKNWVCVARPLLVPQRDEMVDVNKVTTSPAVPVFEAGIAD